MRIDEFLLARIAEDEAVAREATDDGHSWLVEDETIGLWPDDREPADGFMFFPRKAHAHHVAHWQPARVLAECAAKRAVVEMLRVPDPHAVSESCEDCATLYLLAAVYVDHPDFDQAWRA